MRDPYEVLGVKRDATPEEIKKAFRKKAKDHHPDRHPGDTKNAEIFKEISAAYQLLSDKEKRAAYDRGEIDAAGNPRHPFEYAGGPGEAQGPGGGTYRTYHFSGDPFEEIFSFGGGERGGARGGFEETIFDFVDGVRGGGRRTRTRRRARGADRRYRLSVPFVDAIKGATKRITLPGGKTLDVKIPPGIESGRQIRLKGQGEPGPAGTPAGDALVEVTVEPDARFRRDGKAIHVELPVSLPEAVLGAKVRVPTVDGPVTLTIPKGSNTGTRLRLKEKGVPAKDGRGDAYVTLKVVLPENPDPELEAFIEKWSKDHGYDPRGSL